MSNKVYQVNELIESHMKLVPFTINKFFFVKDRETREELMSVGYEALVIAGKRFDPERGGFANYAVITIRSYLLNYFRKERRKNQFAFYSMDMDGKEEETGLHDLLGDESAQFEELIVSKMDVEQLLSRLSDEEKNILSMLLGLDETVGKHTLKEIGETVGCSVSHVWRRKNEALEKLREDALLVG